MPADEERQLAKIAAVAEDLDRILDRLFASVAELKGMLRKPEPGDDAGDKQGDHL